MRRKKAPDSSPGSGNAEIHPSWWGYFWHLFFFWLIVPPVVAYFQRAATVLQIYGIGAVVILQILFTYTPPLQRVFGNEAIPLHVWPWIFLGGLVFFLVVEAEKFIIRSSTTLRNAVSKVETGT